MFDLTSPLPPGRGLGDGVKSCRRVAVRVWRLTAGYSKEGAWDYANS